MPPALERAPGTDARCRGALAVAGVAISACLQRCCTRRRAGKLRHTTRHVSALLMIGHCNNVRHFGRTAQTEAIQRSHHALQWQGSAAHRTAVNDGWVCPQSNSGLWSIQGEASCCAAAGATHAVLSLAVNGAIQLCGSGLLWLFIAWGVGGVALSAAVLFLVGSVSSASLCFRHPTSEWSGVQWGGVEWSGVEWSAVQCSAVQCSAVEWNGVKIRIGLQPTPTTGLGYYWTLLLCPSLPRNIAAARGKVIEA